MGRHSSFSQEIADRICEELASGKSMRQVCSVKGMPNRETVRRWELENEEFAAKCARAREVQADVLLDEMEDIEDRTISGEIHPVAARAVLSSKQWRAAKLAPKRYGDKIEHEHTGKGGGPIVYQVMSGVPASPEGDASAGD
jgi:hypothetical protein